MKCHGTAPVLLALASAVQPGGEQFALEALTMLLENNANVSVKVILLDFDFESQLSFKLFGFSLFVPIG